MAVWVSGTNLSPPFVGTPILSLSSTPPSTAFACLVVCHFALRSYPTQGQGWVRPSLVPSPGLGHGGALGRSGLTGPADESGSACAV
jgi:hypothetical protein